jgi:hypothetical protein
MVVVASWIASSRRMRSTCSAGSALTMNPSLANCSSLTLGLRLGQHLGGVVKVVAVDLVELGGLPLARRADRGLLVLGEVEPGLQDDLAGLPPVACARLEVCVDDLRGGLGVTHGP